MLESLSDMTQPNFEILSNALELRFGEKFFKDDRNILQEFSSEIERLRNLTYEKNIREMLSLQYFVNEIKKPEVYTVVRMAVVRDLKFALLHVLKLEAAEGQPSRSPFNQRGCGVQNHRH